MGPVSEDEIRLLRELLTHLRRAVEINHLLGEARAAKFGGEALAHLAQPTAALDDEGRVIECNDAMRSLLNLRDGLTMRDAVFHAPRPREERRLNQVIARAALGRTASAMPLARPSGRRAFGLVATPVPLAQPFFMARRVAALLFVIDPEAVAAEPLSSSVLAEAFELTPMQARVAGMLGRGRTLDECALALDLSRNTVRAHAREVYRTLGLTRQSDLMALLSAWPDAWLSRPGAAG
jgi:DNA-binding CsgD family transcriptional regulator